MAAWLLRLGSNLDWRGNSVLTEFLADSLFHRECWFVFKHASVLEELNRIHDSDGQRLRGCVNVAL